jgi:hypothetical protein
MLVWQQPTRKQRKFKLSGKSQKERQRASERFRAQRTSRSKGTRLFSSVSGNQLVALRTRNLLIRSEEVKEECAFAV